MHHLQLSYVIWGLGKWHVFILYVFFSLYFITATYALFQKRLIPQSRFYIIFFISANMLRESDNEWEKARESERGRHMLTYKTNDGKRYNTKLVIIF